MIRSVPERLARPALLVLFVLALAVGSAGAQGIGQAPGGGAQQGPPPAQNVSDQEVQAVAQAYVAIQELRQKLQQQHGNIATLDSAQARKVQMQFQQESRQILQNQQNITPYRFTQVMQTVQQDAELRQRLTSAIEEQGGGPAMAPGAAAGAPRGRGGAMAAQNFDSEQIEAAASAYVAIQEVKSQYREHQDADPNEEGTQEVGPEIVQTIEEHDLTRETFKQVMLGARTSPQLRTQLLSAIESAQQ